MPIPMPAADALAVVLKHWKAIVTGGVALILLAMILFAKSDARHWHKLADQRAASLAVEQANHAVTRASLESAIKSLDDQSAAVRKLAQESADRIAAADKARAVAVQARQSAEAKAAALDASARAKPSGGAVCRPSKTFDRVKGEL